MMKAQSETARRSGPALLIQELVLVSSAVCWQLLELNLTLQSAVLRIFVLLLLLLLLRAVPKTDQIPLGCRMAGILTALFILGDLFQPFRLYWSFSSIPAKLASLIHMSSQAFLSVLAILLILFALPSCALLLTRLVFLFYEGIRSIAWSELLKMLCGSVCGKEFPVTLTKAVLLILVCVLIGFGCLAGVTALDSDSFESGMEQSAQAFIGDGKDFPLFSWNLDDFTDSIMLLTASDRSDRSLKDRVLLAFRGAISGEDPIESLIDHYLHDVPFDRLVPYGRYWHGYQLTLRPLLMLTSYQGIRIVNGCAQMLLAVCVCILMRKRQIPMITPFLVTWIVLRPLIIGMSLQFSSCFYVSLIGILLLLLKKNPGDSWIVFLFLGCLTSFLDLLTWPVACFGLPACVLLCTLHRESQEYRLFHLFGSGLSWSFGYLGMWASKWLLGSLLTEENVLLDGLERIAYRASDTTEMGSKLGLISCLRDNLSRFFWSPGFPVFLLVLLFLLRKKKDSRCRLSLLFPYFLLALIPFVWYAVTLNHSSVHSYFTCRDLGVSMMAVLFGLTEMHCNSIEKEKPNG